MSELGVVHSLVVEQYKYIMVLKSVLVIALIVVGVSSFSPSPALPSIQRPTSLSSTNKNYDDAITLSTPSSFSRRSAIYSLAGLTVSPLFLPISPASARLEGVNKPELLPSEKGLNVIQVEKFLTKGQEKRMNDLLGKLETDTGYRVKVLCQAYPRTPG